MRSMRTPVFGLMLFSLLFSSYIFLQSNIVQAIPDTFIVTNTNNSGLGSLRQAIEDANANNNPSEMDTISFDISGSGVHTIAPTTVLPAITEKVTIDGYTQTGASPNTTVSPAPMDSVIAIELDGQNLDGANVLLIQANETEVKGLSIFNSTAVDETAGTVRVEASNVFIAGNYIGVLAGGLSRATGTNTISIANAGNDLTIGGTNPEDRNILFAFGQSSSAAAIFSTNPGLLVYGNYIGIGKDGVTDLTPEPADANGLVGPFGLGVNVIGSDSFVGGPTTSQRNVISGNSINVTISSSNNFIQGNYIGTDYTGNVNNSITNGIGVSTTYGEKNLIGGTGNGDGNIIAGVAGTGVNVSDYYFEAGQFSFTADKVAILGNSIHDIKVFDLLGVGNSNLGIDNAKIVDLSDPIDYVPEVFDFFGPNPNDPGDADTGANGMINTPVLKTAQQNGNQVTVTYDLDAAGTDSDYRIEIFANDESTIFGTGPGQTLVGYDDNVATGTDKNITVPVVGDYTNKSISATVTSKDASTPSGYGSTSEMSQNISIGSAVDFDSDGSADDVERQAPNNGDGNNDGIQDSQQPTVTTFQIDSTGIYETLVTTGCSENGTVSSVDVSSLTTKDFGKLYPFGLTDFILNCSRGSTVNVTKYVFTSGTPSSYTVRKYNDITKTYRDVPGSSITSQMVGNTKALIATYSITDGGELDDDATANGTIVDPVGLAVTDLAAVAVPNTGLVSDSTDSSLSSTMVMVITSLTLLSYLALRSTHKRKINA